MEAYAKRIGADFVAITKPSQDWWGLEKFRVQPFAQSYERTLYVDADVFLTEETPDLFDVVPVLFFVLTFLSIGVAVVDNGTIFCYKNAFEAGYIPL